MLILMPIQGIFDTCDSFVGTAFYEIAEQYIKLKQKIVALWGTPTTQPQPGDMYNRVHKSENLDHSFAHFYPFIHFLLFE